MIERAKSNVEKLGVDNVEFVFGEIEDIPLDDNLSDVVVSNCVFNLVPDKAKAFSETYRILKPGGHFSISDIVIEGQLPEDLRKAAELYVGCVSGAIQKQDYLKTIRDAGFVELKIQKERQIELTDQLLDEYLTSEAKQLFLKSNVGVHSITVSASKPIN